MRRIAPLALVVAAASLALVGPAHADAGHDSARTVAEGACEPMVRDAIAGAVDTASVGTPHATWHGDRFTCRVPVGAGSILLRVDVEAGRGAATATYARARHRAGPAEQLTGLGDRAFQTDRGLFVARKDRFVARIDPGRLPTALDHHAVAFAAAEALMACWEG